ncbi:hypothetical protein AMATHDRAFT_52544 [Amanita thiersii Skay4041]|uniref:Uncharacterized protein n=1 Tax=Amanita thiersii Skay4041 TaxID=703135 RepID=A0A2A9P1R5_9AGAR|nr:hypothetical protein AMATHDRAFT_52544 [Amanita thiersii Skay4041]
MTEQVPPIRYQQPYAASKDLQWIQNAIHGSELLTQNISPDAAHLQARLRSYLTLCTDARFSPSFHAALHRKRTASRVFIYSLRNYSPETRWGPLLKDGAVNWVHIEYLSLVILANLYELPNNLAIRRPRLGLESIRPYSAPGPCHERDWAGVTGRLAYTLPGKIGHIVLQHSHVYFKFSENPCDHNFFEDPRFREATRLMEVKIALVDPETLQFYSTLRPLCLTEPEYKSSYPTLYFNGSTRGVHGHEAGIEGFVKMEKQNYIYWHFTAIYGTSQQWSSCGVQVGGPASAVGVVGVWTTSAHHRGPFWLWKVQEDYPKELIEYT